MENEIIPYLEMCQRESVNLQQGMNYHLGHTYSVILMSVRPNAPYRDVVVDDGATLIYEGHDVPRLEQSIDPKSVDQPEFTSGGQLTQNGKFHKAAQDFKKGVRAPETVRAYEKIRSGIWSYNGVFHLSNFQIFRKTKEVYTLIKTSSVFEEEEGIGLNEG